MNQPRSNYVIVDLEATCWERGQEEARSEIIEIGAMVYTPGDASDSPRPEWR